MIVPSTSNVKSHEENQSLTNYISFEDPTSHSPRIGHYNATKDSIQPLAFASGTPLETLYQVIQIGETGIIASGNPIQASSTKILPPITGRDILCVGKNYAEHAKEFNSSGFDSSDKVDQPTHPVIFTKRFTSIIADGEDIYPHLEFTQTADYEGEVGVIVGKAGFRIAEAEAMGYVWGYTIVNDVTARERQRDHKQFYIGKSADTFCPMGPIAVPADKLDKTLRVQTHVNGDLRQDATIDDLIFSIPFLIKTLSEGQTLMPGDVIATGTPVGVGIGRKPPVYLKPGDKISVSVTGLGKLTNRVGSKDAENKTLSRIQQATATNLTHVTKSVNPSSLTEINRKLLNYQHRGNGSGAPIVFVHGIGGTIDYWNPLIHSSGLSATHSLHLFDLEGHGMSPTSPLSKLTIKSWAADLKAVVLHAGITSGATIIAQSAGCLIALDFILQNPGIVSKLILIGPPASASPETGSRELYARAMAARTKGMAAVVDDVATTETSERTKKENPLALTAVRLLLLGQNPEGYAKACSAPGEALAEGMRLGEVRVETLVVACEEDDMASPALCEGYSKSLPGSVGVKVLTGVGSWPVFEDAKAVAEAIQGFI